MDRLHDRLEDNDELRDLWAERVLEQAQGIAATRPTPQAPMAAEAMGVRNGTILSLSGGPPGAVAAGSEFGSDIYRQFQRAHSSRGYWLLPAAEDPSPATIAAGEGWLDLQVERSIHGL